MSCVASYALGLDAWRDPVVLAVLALGPMSGQIVDLLGREPAAADASRARRTLSAVTDKIRRTASRVPCIDDNWRACVVTAASVGLIGAGVTLVAGGVDAP